MQSFATIGYDLHLDIDNVTIPAGGTNLLPTGIAAKAPDGTYLCLAAKSGLTIKKNVTPVAGVINPDDTGCITIVMNNFGTEDQTFSIGDKIAQLIVEKASTPTIQLVSSLPKTKRGADGFGSTDFITVDDLFLLDDSQFSNAKQKRCIPAPPRPYPFISF